MSRIDKIISKMKIFRFFLVIGLLSILSPSFAQIEVGTNFDIKAAVPIDIRTVAADTITRNALTWKYEGMIVHVLSDNTNYQLIGGTDNSDWVALNTGSYIAGTGMTLSGYMFSAKTDSAIWNANKLAGNAISSSMPNNDQIMVWNNTQTQWEPQNRQYYYPGNGITLLNDTFLANSDSNIWNAYRLQGNNISSLTPSLNNILKWNGTEWVPSIDENTTYSAGTGISLSGTTINADSNIAIWNANKLQGNNLAADPPDHRDILIWDTTSLSWKPGIQQYYYPGTGITLTNDTFYAQNTNNIWNANLIQGHAVYDTQPAASQILKWNGTSWFPAIDENTTYSAGSGIFFSGTQINALNSIAMWNANQIQGRMVSTTNPSASGQVLKWTGVWWEPGTDENTTYTPGTGINISANNISAQNTSNIWNANQIQSADISSSIPSDGQALVWNATLSEWEPQNQSGSYKGGNGINVDVDTIHALYDTAIWNANKILDLDVDATHAQNGKVLTFSNNKLVFDSVSIYDSFNGNRPIKQTAANPSLAGNVGGTTIIEFLNNYFFPFIPATISINSGTTYEIGTSNSVNINGTVTANDETSFSNGLVKRIHPDTASVFSFGSNLNYSTSVTFAPIKDSSSTLEHRFAAFQDVDNNGNPTTINSSTMILRSVYPFLYGVNSDSTLTNGGTSAYTGLTKLVASKSNKTVTLNGTGYVYFAFPASYGDLISIIDQNSFEQLTAFTKYVSNVSSSALTNNWTNTSYHIYRSNSPTNPSNWNYQFKFN
jgi:hypothetical protein